MENIHNHETIYTNKDPLRFFPEDPSTNIQPTIIF